MFAAIAAEASREHGKFDTFHALLITLNDFSEESIRSLAQRSGIDKEQFQRDLHGSAERRVLADLQIAKSLGVKSTPSFFLCTPEGIV
jgi:predicted DsbA family dithiol-disulfide isomerase